MIRYSDLLDGIKPENLEGFFEGWANSPSPETHMKLLEGSTHIILAKEGERVVGFITAITDGVLSAYIPLLEVLPEYRSQGIGKELVRLMLLKLEDYYMVDLTCDPALRSFYLEQGMSALTAMAKRNRQHQAGRSVTTKNQESN